MLRDAELIRNLKDPDLKDRAFNTLLDLYQERLYWHVRKIVTSHDNANDVLQNTFIRVYRNIHAFKEKSSLHTWMFRIAYNESIRFLEKNNRKSHYSLNEIHDRYLQKLTQDTYFDGDELKLKLHTVLSQLSDKQRHIFQMKYFDALSFRQISEILDISENTLKSSYYSVVKIIEKQIVL